MAPKRARKKKKVSSKTLDLLKINTMPLEEFKEWGIKQEKERLENERRVNGPKKARKNSEFVNELNVDQTRMTPWRVGSPNMNKVDPRLKETIEKDLAKDNRRIYEYRLDETKGDGGFMPHFNTQRLLIGLIIFFARGFVLGTSDRLKYSWPAIFRYLLWQKERPETKLEANSRNKNRNVPAEVFPFSHVTYACYEKWENGPYQEWYEFEYEPKVLLEKDFDTITFPLYFRIQLWEAFNRYKKDPKIERKIKKLKKILKAQSFVLLTDATLKEDANEKPKIPPIRIVLVPPKAVSESLPKQAQDLTKVNCVEPDSTQKDDFVKLQPSSSTSSQNLAKRIETNGARLKAQEERVGTKRNVDKISEPKASNKKPRIPQQSKPELFKKAQKVFEHYRSQTKVNLPQQKQKSVPAQTLEEAIKTIDPKYQFTNRSEQDNRVGNLDKHANDQIDSFSNRSMICLNEANAAVQNMLAAYDTPNSSVGQDLDNLEKELQNRFSEFAEPNPMMAQSLVAVPQLANNVPNEHRQSIATIEQSTDWFNCPIDDFVKTETPCPSVCKRLDKNVSSSTMSSADNDRIGQKHEDQPIKQTQTRENNIDLATVIEQCIHKDEPASDTAIPKDQGQTQVDQNIGNPETSGTMISAQANRTLQAQSVSIPEMTSGPFAWSNPTIQPEAAAALMNYHQTVQAYPRVDLGIYGQGPSLNMVQYPVTIPNNSGQQVFPGNQNSLANDRCMQGSSHSWSLAQNPVQGKIPLGLTNHQSGQNMATKSISNQSGHPFWSGNAGYMQGLNHPYGNSNRTMQTHMPASLMNNPFDGNQNIAPRLIEQPMQYPVLPVQSQSVGGHLDRHNNAMWQSGLSSSFAGPNRVPQTLSNVPLTQIQNPMIGQYWNSLGINGPVLACAEPNGNEPDYAYHRELALNVVYGFKAANECNKIELRRSAFRHKLRTESIEVGDAIVEHKCIQEAIKFFMHKIQNGEYEPITNDEHNRSVQHQFAAPLLQIPTVSSSTVGQPMEMTNNRINGTGTNGYGPQGQMNLGSSAVPPMGLPCQSNPPGTYYGATGNVGPSHSAVPRIGQQYPSNAAGMIMYQRTQNAQVAAVSFAHCPYQT